jgi:hypothetical protein
MTLTKRNSTRRTLPNNTVQGPSPETKPNYESIVGPLGKFMDKIFMAVFRRELAQQVGKDTHHAQDDYQGIIELAAKMNRQFTNRTDIHIKAEKVLQNLFPSWMPVRTYVCVCVCVCVSLHSNLSVCK